MNPDNAREFRIRYEHGKSLTPRETDAMLTAYASERVEALKPWLHHHIGCGTLKAREAEGLFATNLRVGDEKTCTCGLARALTGEEHHE